MYGFDSIWGWQVADLHFSPRLGAGGLFYFFYDKL